MMTKCNDHNHLSQTRDWTETKLSQRAIAITTMTRETVTCKLPLTNTQANPDRSDAKAALGWINLKRSPLKA